MDAVPTIAHAIPIPIATARPEDWVLLSNADWNEYKTELYSTCDKGKAEMTPKSIKKNTYASEKRFLDLLVLWDCYSSTLKEEERSRVANVPKMSSAQCRGKT